MVDIILKDEAKDKLVAGVKKLSEVVGLTLGPRGQNVVLYRDEKEAPLITNDGVSIAKEIVLKDPYENMGAQLVVEVASKTNAVAGDGTTTSTVLTNAIVHEGIGAIAMGHNPILLKRGMNEAIKDIEKEINKFKREVTTSKEIARVAAISSGSEDIGKLIGDAIDKMGRDGVITLGDSENHETKIIISEGYEIDRGLISHLMITDHDREKAIHTNPFIYITNKVLKSMTDVLKPLQLASENNKSLVIICDGLEGQALESILFNMGTVKCSVIKAPGFGESKDSLLEDIGVTVGAKVFNEKLGDCEIAGIEDFGTATSVEADKNKTIIINGLKDTEKFNERVNIVRKLIEDSEDEFLKDTHRERLAKLNAGVAVIKCGAKTETEQLEKKLRIEDAVNATKAAIKDGIVIGGGATLLHAFSRINIPENLSPEEKAGYQCVLRAMLAPIRTILENANFSPEGIENIIAEIVDKRNTNLGYDAMDFKIKDFFEAGIIDPAKVTISALENAVSVAGTLLTTNAAIIPLD